jgi:hypothetical protein
MCGGKSRVAAAFIGTLLVERPLAVKGHGPSLRGATATKQSRRPAKRLDCFAPLAMTRKG